MNYKWSFIIRTGGRDFFIEDLMYNLRTDDISIYEGGDEETGSLTYYFTSIHLNHLTEPLDIYDKALQLTFLANAIELLIQENKNNAYFIELERLIDVENNSPIFINQTKRPTVLDIDFTINETNKTTKRHIVSRIIELAKTEEFIRNILFIISEGMTFISMYRALDEIKYFLKSNGDNLDNLGFPKKGLINDFTHTANNYQSLGLKARHGSTGHRPPEEPMNISDAQKLLTDIIKTIFIKYYGIDIPEKKDKKFNVSDLFDK
ncbi:hypothetical protein [Cellulophaga baltica]|nr:hypothetical protein [Cellulophaga baltica]